MELLRMNVAFHWLGVQGSNLLGMCTVLGTTIMHGCVSICIVLRGL